MTTLAWLPAHPAMGWASMNRYWHALDQQAAASSPSDLSFVCPLKSAAIEQVEAPSWQRQWARNISYPRKVRLLHGVDAVHVLDHSFAELLRWVKPNVKKIVTVHDIIPLIDASGLSEAQVLRFRSRMEWLHKADALLCVSEFTKQCLIEHLGLESQKLRVLPNGVSLPTTVPSLLDLDAPRPWLLLVGSNLERKNLKLIPDVLKHLQECGIEPTILRIGPALKPELRARIGQGRVVELGFVSDAVLASAYASADALFFPSTLEGYGLPVVEAMAHGCPVVCARSSSLPEVAGDAALFFDQDDAVDAAKQCALALTDATRHDDLKSRGQARAQQFTWARHFDQLCGVYREVLAA